MGRNGKKFKDGYLFVRLRQSLSKNAITSKSFDVLEMLWAKGVHPQTLQKHFYLTWLVFAKGNVLGLARLIREHRNTVILILRDWGIRSTYRVRVFLKEMGDKHPKQPLENMVGLLYGRAFSGLEKPRHYRGFKKAYSAKINASLAPKLSRTQNSALVRLWLSGFPFRGLRVHYVFWATRKGWRLERISKTLGVSIRTLHRIRVGVLKYDRSSHQWFSKIKLEKEGLSLLKSWGGKGRSTSEKGALWKNSSIKFENS